MSLLDQIEFWIHRNGSTEIRSGYHRYCAHQPRAAVEQLAHVIAVDEVYGPRGDHATVAETRERIATRLVGEAKRFYDDALSDAAATRARAEEAT